MTPEAIAAITRAAVLVAEAIDRASERNVKAIIMAGGYADNAADQIINDTKPKKGA